MKVLIADDEALIRKSISLHLQKCQIDAQCIHEVSDGEKAMAILTQGHDFDLVFIDIQMPQFSGLAIIEKVKVLHPHTSFYVISGYSQFDYVRTALLLSVTDYLLKPVSFEQIKAIVQTESIRLEDAKKARAAQIASQCQTAFRENHLPQPEPYLLACVCDPSPKAACTLQVQQGISLCLTEHHIFYSTFDFQGHRFFAVPDRVDAFSLKTLLASFMTNTHCSLICRQNDSPDSRPDFQMFMNCVYFSHFMPLNTCHLVELILKTFRQKNETLVLAQSYSLLHHARDTKNYFQYRKNADIFAKAFQNCYKALQPQQTQQLLARLAQLFPAEHPLNTPNDLPAFLEKYALSTLLCQTEGMALIEQVVSYIQQHYSENLSVSSIAAYFYISPNYLSTLFHNKMHIPASKFINQTRVEHAAQMLLETRLPLSTIAQKCGFADSNYLIKVFRKSTGLTPADFRKTHSVERMDNPNSLVDLS